jgi:hypothetical protein
MIIIIITNTFFESVCDDVEPFLIKFQLENPQTPFLYERISILVKGAMNKIAKPEVLSTSELSKIDILKKSSDRVFENLLPVKK